MEQNTPTTCDVRTYKNTPTGAPMKTTQLTIAYSKDKNLFDILCSSTLKENTHTVEDILQHLKT